MHVAQLLNFLTFERKSKETTKLQQYSTGTFIHASKAVFRYSMHNNLIKKQKTSILSSQAIPAVSLVNEVAYFLSSDSPACSAGKLPKLPNESPILPKKSFTLSTTEFSSSFGGI